MRRLSSSLLGDLDEAHLAECKQFPPKNDNYNRTNSLNRHGKTAQNNVAETFISETFPTDAPAVEPTLLFCKNNVCVHPPTTVSTKVDHSPGYLSIKSHEDQFGGQTLLLTWIPNTQLKRGTSVVTDALHSGASPLFTPPPSSKSRLRSRTSSISSDVAQSEPPPTPNHGGIFHRVSSEGSSWFESLRGMLSGPPSRAQSRPDSPTESFTTIERVVKKVSRANSLSSEESSPKHENVAHTEEFQNLLNDINNFCSTEGESDASKTKKEAQSPETNGYTHNDSVQSKYVKARFYQKMVKG